METKIVEVIVFGGVVQDVKVPAGVTVLVRDYDVTLLDVSTDDGEGITLEHDEAGSPHVLSTYEGGPDIEPEPERRLIGYDDYT